MHLGLIGFGNIGQALLRVLAQEGSAPERLTMLVRDPGRLALPAGADVVRVGVALAAARPDLVIECAGQGAVAAHVPDCLSGGCDTVVASVGALADDALHDTLRAVARAGKARLILPAGAVGAIDLLAALRPSGIARVRYTGRKPPLAWAGTPGVSGLDLGALPDAVTIFEGTARDAARLYPKNANVAATVALAGMGFDLTEVRLVADPAVSRNIHELSVQAGAADFTVKIEGHPSPDNPRTSLATVYSLARAVFNHSREVAI